MSQQEISRSHYERNKEVYKTRAREQRSRLRERLTNYKAGKPCVVCGETFPPVAMDFHHRDPTEKDRHLSFLVCMGSWSRIMDEVVKCDLVCANCHRVIHAQG